MTCSSLRTRILGVVVGAATVDGMMMSFTTARTSTQRMCSSSARAATSMVAAGSVDARRYAVFIKEKVGELLRILAVQSCL